MIPGVNLLNVARQLIKFQEVMYMADQGRVLDDVGQWVTSYANPVGLMASVQAVKRDKYAELGLEFQKKYVKIFASIDAIDINRDETGDRFIFGRELYQIESQTTWYVQDGWCSCLCVAIKVLSPDEKAEYERQRVDSTSAQ